MSQEINRIKEIIDKTKSGSTIRIQGEMIRALIAEVEQFVNAVNQDHQAVAEAKNIPREINRLKNEEGKETEIKEAEAALKEANEVERTLKAKRDLLRKIDSDAQALRSSIAKGLR